MNLSPSSLCFYYYPACCCFPLYTWVPNERESGVFVTELNRTWKEELQGASYYNGNPSDHLPYVGGLDEHVTIDELSTEAQYLDLSGNQGASVGVNHACKKQRTLRFGTAPGLAHDADAMGPP
ncbi:hypothetical protein Tco_1121666 [Tanacetum coccineum]|uniref:Uncharacterized protein n=1 Tax=Tanacetum coccineum TaxID=301880 RepID=A0ABQ5IYQ8_9ASTR